MKATFRRSFWRALATHRSLFALLAVGAYSSVNADVPLKCDNVDISEMKSPDGEWVARVYGKLCDLGIQLSAAVLVDLVPAKSRGPAITVLSEDMPSDKDYWPKPKWESLTKLVIALPVDARIAQQVAAVRNIDVQIQFCGGYPADHDRWMAYQAARYKWVKDNTSWIRLRDQDPARAGPQPMPPTPPGGQVPATTCGK